MAAQSKSIRSSSVLLYVHTAAAVYKGYSRGAEDGHLDFLTAPTEQGFSSMLLYVHRDHEDC